jgi:hypothetical protein
MRALNPFAPFWYTPVADQGEEHPTRFKIRGLNGTEVGYVGPEFILDNGTISGLTGKGLEMTLKYGLLDWENFENDSGKIAFNRANFGLIPYEVQAEIAMNIIAASYAKEEAKKT